MAKPPSRFVCPVCLFPGLSGPARSKKTGGGSLEICPCCGFQHGVDDDDQGVSYAQARAKWVKAGAKWFSKSQHPPQGWAAKSQLLSGPDDGAHPAEAKAARKAANPATPAKALPNRRAS